MKLKITKELLEGFKMCSKMRIDERICGIVKENINFSHQCIKFPEINYNLYEKIDNNIKLDSVLDISLIIEAIIEQEIKYNIYENKYYKNALNVLKDC